MRCGLLLAATLILCGCSPDDGTGEPLAGGEQGDQEQLPRLVLL